MNPNDFLFNLGADISRTHANVIRQALGLPSIPLVSMQTKDDFDEICDQCGERDGDPHKPTCPACTAQGLTCEGGVGRYDGLD